MVLRTLLLFFLFFCFGCSEKNPESTFKNSSETTVSTTGKDLYLVHCEACHGLTGNKGVSGAADLSTSTLSDSKIQNTIMYGNNKGMMPYKDIISSSKELDSIVQFVKKLRK